MLPPTLSPHRPHFPHPLVNHLRPVVRQPLIRPMPRSTLSFYRPHTPQPLVNHLRHIVWRLSTQLIPRPALSPHRLCIPQPLANHLRYIVRRPSIRPMPSSTLSPHGPQIPQLLVNHLRHVIRWPLTRPTHSSQPILDRIQLVSHPIPQHLLVGRLSHRLHRGRLHPLCCFPRFLRPAVRSPAPRCFYPPICSLFLPSHLQLLPI